MRIKFGQKWTERQSASAPGVVTDVYKVHLTDIDKPGFLLLRAHLKKRPEFKQGDAYLVDKVKLIVNRKTELILQSTTLTVLRSESEDSFTVESLELSQKQHDEAIPNDEILEIPEQISADLNCSYILK